MIRFANRHYHLPETCNKTGNKIVTLQLIHRFGVAKMCDIKKDNYFFLTHFYKEQYLQNALKCQGLTKEMVLEKTKHIIRKLQDEKECYPDFIDQFLIYSLLCVKPQKSFMHIDVRLEAKKYVTETIGKEPLGEFLSTLHDYCFSNDINYRKIHNLFLRDISLSVFDEDTNGCGIVFENDNHLKFLAMPFQEAVKNQMDTVERLQVSRTYYSRILEECFSEKEDMKKKVEELLPQKNKRLFWKL